MGTTLHIIPGPQEPLGAKCQNQFQVFHMQMPRPHHCISFWDWLSPQGLLVIPVQEVLVKFKLGPQPRSWYSCASLRHLPRDGCKVLPQESQGRDKRGLCFSCL